MVGPTPEGLRALAEIRHRTYFGTSGQRLCKAKSKRTGKPCGQVAMRGKDVCRHHGGHSKGRGKRTPMEQRTPRQQRNYFIREARRVAREELEGRQLHAETMAVFRAQFAAKVYPSDVPRFLLALDKYMQGDMDLKGWQQTLEDLATATAG